MLLHGDERDIDFQYSLFSATFVMVKKYDVFDWFFFFRNMK